MERKYNSQLGKTIPDPGAHMPHVVVGILRKRRSKQEFKKEHLKGGSKERPVEEYNPYPNESYTN